MSTTLDWTDIVLRLGLALIAGGLIGLNRTEGGRPAGLRTTILVCLSAAVAMLQANYLLVTSGRTPDSFIMADVLRLPLGVLSGMGFIGGGAILRRGSLVLGVTTAATLWFVTIMGLCFGGGQILLGMTMLVVGLAVLWGLLLVEEGIEQDRRGSLIVSLGGDGPSEAEIRSSLLGAGFKILSAAVTYTAPAHLHEIRCDLQWRGHPSDVESPAVLRQLAERSGVVKVEWRT